MKFIYVTIILISTCLGSLWAQSVPVGSNVEDVYRRQQLVGTLDSTISFSIRPLFPILNSAGADSFDPDSILKFNNLLQTSNTFRFLHGAGQFLILPLSWQQQYNTNHPYGWNDGAMISSKGYQSILSGGFYAKIGPLSIQLRPEYVYAQNSKFEGIGEERSDEFLSNYYVFYNQLDVPDRLGNSTYSKLTWGQSSIRITVGPASVGLSNENLWWGPGIQNSLLMTNNAAGFKHITLNTVKPIRTKIGSFEAQIIAGKLEGSNLSPIPQTSTSTGLVLFNEFNPDWRYLTGFNINYQPRWVPGLFVGFIRDFMSYHNDLNGFGDYLPFFTPVQKVNTGPDAEGDSFARDQRLSFYSRWLFQKAHAEVYFEYGLNDNSYNIRDFAGSPDHGRAYVFGFTKLTSFMGRKNQFIQINAEINQLSQSADRLIRPAGGFYQHYQVRQGYSHSGQFLGAGTGDGGNLQTLDLSWINGVKKVGLLFQRFEHNADYYEQLVLDLNGQSRRWIDFAIGAQGMWDYKNLILSAKIQTIKSYNYQWRMKNYTADSYYVPQNNLFNFHGEVGVSFRF